MNTIKYSKPLVYDIKDMQTLVEPEVEKGLILYRSADEMATTIRSYILAKDGEQIVGFVALHIHSTSLAEVRSLIVKESHRNKGIGRALVKSALNEASMLGLKEVLTLTYHKELFLYLGFKEIPKESIPEHKIWADCIRCKHFPICDEVSLVFKL
ncbi:MAG: N-acetyltransferase [Arcobacter butzleri]|jgi:amino-acid N-acetyltransferase|nr:N-acetyltransferase [Arcobacteraceae bacterium]MDY0365374.1 N-acetyltransferase [Arcobacteraceae bacterium]NLO17209.1 N-acetyltransferase [Aliarcobacter butzleri]